MRHRLSKWFGFIYLRAYLGFPPGQSRDKDDEEFFQSCFRGVVKQSKLESIAPGYKQKKLKCKARLMRYISVTEKSRDIRFRACLTDRSRA